MLVGYNVGTNKFTFENNPFRDLMLVGYNVGCK